MVVAAGLLFGLYTGYTKFQLTEGMETIFTVFRDAVLMNVDEPDPEKLTNNAVWGILRQLDPYAAYIPEEGREQFQTLTTGDYGGIGALVQQADKYARVAELYEGAPAAKAGLFVGDTLVSIDGQTTRGLTITEVSNRLKGVAGSTIALRVRRPYRVDTLTIKFKRDRVHLPAVGYSHRFSDGVGYVSLTTFTHGCALAVEEALVNLEKKGPLTGVVLDLRGNGGGLLEEAIQLVGFFIPSGDTVVMVKGRVGKDEVALSRGEGRFASLPLVVLVDRESASSSEVVAGSLQDMDRAAIVGERTFGKGLVQTTRALPYGGILKLTTAKYYTPSGRCIQALDYAHRDKNGAVGEIPDSLITRYQTRHGRYVYDGGGVWPDLEADGGNQSLFVANLYAQLGFFEYATLYRSQHPSIPPVAEFKASQGDIADFKRFLIQKGYPAKSSMLRLTKQLRDMAKGEDQYELLQGYLDSADRAIERSFSEYFDKNLPLITTLLEEEIASRYYYAGGRAAKALARDSVLHQGLHLLQDSAQMRRLLRKISPADPRGKKVG